MDIRSIVVTALIDLLEWDRRKALVFLDSLSEGECEDIEEHVRESSSPIVGVAAVVYRVRLRMAGSDQQAKQRAAIEANEHYRLMPTTRASGIRASESAPEQPPKTYRVADRSQGSRRRDYDRAG